MSNPLGNTLPNLHPKQFIRAASLLAMVGVLGCTSSQNFPHGNSSFTSSITQNDSAMVSLKQHFSAVGILNALTPKQDFSVQPDIAYGQDQRQKLDVYQPLQSGHRKPRPVILFVHGGSWEQGSKEDYLFVGESFTRAGYVTVIMNYRLAPAHQYPDYVQDTALAIQWINRNIARYGANPQQIVVMGHSAGAFNVVEAVDNLRWLSEVEVPVSHIRAVIGIAGPYSYDFRTDSSRNAFPASASPDQVMPDRHVRADAPPHLLLTGSNDQRVKLANAQKMQAALQARQIPVQLDTVQGASHVSIMAAVASRLAWYHDTRQQILDYLARTLKA